MGPTEQKLHQQVKLTVQYCWLVTARPCAVTSLCPGPAQTVSTVGFQEVVTTAGGRSLTVCLSSENRQISSYTNLTKILVNVGTLNVCASFQEILENTDQWSM